MFEGLVSAPEPDVAVVELEPVGAVSALDVLLEPEPASPESLPLELLLPEPAKPESLPLELPEPEPARPLPPALELGVPSFGFAKPPPAVLEPGLPEVVGGVLVPVPEVLPGRFEGVLSPLPALELGWFVPVWLGREDSAPETGLTGVPEGRESRLEVGCRLLLEGPPVAACETVEFAELGAFVSRLEPVPPPPAKPFVSGARLAPDAPTLKGLLASPGCAALERTLASCNFPAPEVAPLETRARPELFAVLELPEVVLIFSAAPVLVTLERNKFGLARLELKLGNIACCAEDGASNGERCCSLITCEALGFNSFNGACRVLTTGFGNGLEMAISDSTRGVTGLTA